MALLDLFRRERRNLEDPTVPVSARDLFARFGVSVGGVSSAGVTVTIDNALGVPAIWSAVNFMSGTIAALPLVLYKRKQADRQRVRGALATLLSDAVNDETTSFAWRKAMFEAVLTGGRHCTYIERNRADQVMNLWPLDPSSMQVVRTAGRRQYILKDGGLTKTYEAREIIDIAFMLKDDGLAHRGPINTSCDTIGMAIAATEYASRFFRGGGVPPFAVTGKFESPAAMDRAAKQFGDAVAKAAREDRQALILPPNYEVKAIGSDPEKSQLIEAKRFIIEEIARIYSLPPAFLQDLTHGTFSNTEQQDLHFVKHTLVRWVKQVEQELNLKLFGRSSTVQFVEFNVDGLLRGDFKTRMEGYATAINASVLKPNEARRLENRPDDPAGDRLFIQGATVPLDLAGKRLSAPAPVASNGDQTNAA